MDREEKEQYMSMILDLLRKNRITYLDFCIFGVNNFAELECMTDKQRGELGRNLGEALTQSFTEKDI